jgi:hypothetical protein
MPTDEGGTKKGIRKSSFEKYSVLIVADKCIIEC